MNTQHSQNSNPEIIPSILEYLHLTLRYIASGFVAVGVYIFLFGPDLELFKEHSWFLVFISATIGMITYGLHFATLDKTFHGFSLMNFLKKNKYYIPCIIDKHVNEWRTEAHGGKHKFAEQIKVELTEIHENGNSISGKEKREKKSKIKRGMLFSLAHQSYLRIVSKEDFYVKLQNQFEKRLALLNFLYCSCYQILIIFIYFCLTRILVHDYFNSDEFPKDCINAGFVLAFGGLMLWCARRFNDRISSRELWFSYAFPIHFEVKKEFQANAHIDGVKAEKAN